MQAQRQALAAQFRSATQQVYSSWKEQRYGPLLHGLSTCAVSMSPAMFLGCLFCRILVFHHELPCRSSHLHLQLSLLDVHSSMRLHLCTLQMHAVNGKRNSDCMLVCDNIISDCFRRQELLIQSKVWITPETLDARIDEALENPIELYEAASEKNRNPREDF